MAQPSVFITRVIPEPGLSMIREVAQVDLWKDELPPSYEVLLEKVRDVDGLLCLLTDRIDARLLNATGPNFKVISQYAVGFDNIDVPSATQKGIPIGNTPGALTDATADFTWALLMAAARRVVEGDRYTRAGEWKTWGPTTLLGPNVSHATLGLVGLGRIGQGVARRAGGFDMRILYYDPNRHTGLEESLGVEFSSLERLLRQSDFISMHTPLSQQTFHMIGSEQFKMMKPSAVLINTSRGPVIDPDALYQALKDGVIAGAALDVTETEPIPPSSPLLTLPNLIITPHIASASIQSRAKMAELAAINLIAGLQGQRLPNCVNPEVYRG